MLTETEIKKIVEQIVNQIKPDKIILFGSYAKGKATYKSDLDLFIIKNTHLPITQRSQEIKSVLSTLYIGIDIHVYTQEEVEEYGSENYSFIHSVLETGIVLYEQTQLLL